MRTDKTVFRQLIFMGPNECIRLFPLIPRVPFLPWLVGIGWCLMAVFAPRCLLWKMVALLWGSS
jgi:hypothetical protein